MRYNIMDFRTKSNTKYRTSFYEIGKKNIFETFFSKLFGEKKILPQLRNWVSVPIKQGGTSIPKPEEIADLNCQASTCECSHLLGSLKNRELFDSACHTNTMTAVRARIKEEKVAKADRILDGLKSKMDKFGARKVDYLREKGTGAWLASTPSNLCGTVILAVEFRDELRDCYGFEMLNDPSHCDGCCSKLSATHALSCKKGGLIHTRHDESRDSLGCLACAVFQPSNVCDEPQINPCHGIGRKDGSNGETLIESNSGTEITADRGDLLIRSFWDRNANYIIDVRICDVNHVSYHLRKPAAVIKSAEGVKKRKYLEPCLT